MKTQEELRSRFLLNDCGLKNYAIEPIQSDLSGRKYFRIRMQDGTYVLMDKNNAKCDLDDFKKIDEDIRNIELSAPKIFHFDRDKGFILLEDYSDATYKNILTDTHKYCDYPSEERLYERAIDVLVHLHKNYKNTGLKSYDYNTKVKESCIFIDWYVSILNGDKVSDEHREEFITILKNLFEHIETFPSTMVLRDYHSENIFWLMEEVGIKKVGLIDFQDAVWGSPLYDIVSLLEDTRHEISEELSTKIITRYLGSFPSYNRKEFMAAFTILSIQRNLKIIGQFARAASQNKNSKYLTLLPKVWKYVYKSISHPLLLPLKNWMEVVLPSKFKAYHANEKRIFV